jgi:hypothetical protein
MNKKKKSLQRRKKGRRVLKQARIVERKKN